MARITLDKVHKESIRIVALSLLEMVGYKSAIRLIKEESNIYKEEYLKILRSKYHIYNDK